MSNLMHHTVRRVGNSARRQPRDNSVDIKLVKRLSTRILANVINPEGGSTSEFVGPINEPMNVLPGFSLGFKEKHDNAWALNPPNGVIPFLLQIQNGTVSLEDALQAADACAIAKNEFTRRGDYYRAWLSGWRERMISRVVQGLTTFSLIKT